MVVSQQQRAATGSAEFVFYVSEFILPDVDVVLQRTAPLDAGFIRSVTAGYSFNSAGVLYFSHIDNRPV